MTQNQALAIMESGQSVLLTGAAGTGKTFLLNRFIRRAKINGKNVAVTATTGLAATHLNGTTLHSWAGIGISDEITNKALKKFSKQRKDIINKTDILVIDEISMLHDYRLDLVNKVTSYIRQNDEQFGGLQVILCGDFYQLPPVNRYDSRQGTFITNSNSWQQGSFDVCYLEKQFRQAEDDIYLDILDGIRQGILKRKLLDALYDRKNYQPTIGEVHTKIYTTNIDVDTINEKNLNQLTGKLKKFIMVESGSKKYIDQLKKFCLSPEVLYLKKDALVMCIKNSKDKKYVNGSLGKIIAFDRSSGYPIVQLNNGKSITILPDTWELIDGDKKRASVTQVPLRLAWAITVHKSQGMTLDAAQIDLSNAFVEGMGYVALSRVRSMENLFLGGLNSMALKVSSSAKTIDADLRNRSSDALLKHDDYIKEWQIKEKLNKNIMKTNRKSAPNTWSEKLEVMRKDYPNAYRPWQKHEDFTLKKEMSNGSIITLISKLLGRHPGSIIKRAEKIQITDGNKK